MRKKSRLVALLAAVVMAMGLLPGAVASPAPQAAAPWPPVEVDLSIQQDGGTFTAMITLRNVGDFDIDTFNVSGGVPRGARYVDSWAGGRGFNAGIFNGSDVRWTNSGIKAGARQGPFSYMFDSSALPAGSSADVTAAVSWSGKVPGTAVSRAVAVRGGAAPPVAAPAPPAAAPPARVAGASTLEWFGWSHFRLTSADGLVIIINPFITNNPDASIKVEDITKADVILAADGHGDEQGDSIAIAQNTGAKLIGAGFELGSWFIQQGVPASQVIRTNPGDRHKFGAVTIRVVNSVHGSGLPRPTLENPYGGPAGGFLITLEDGFTLYFAGSTAATMDMQLWGSTFKPDLAILPLNGGRDPIDLAQMVRLLRTDNPNLTRVIPHHQRVQQPAGATTVAEMAEAIRSMVGTVVTVMEPQRGQVVSLAKAGAPPAPPAAAPAAPAAPAPARVAGAATLEWLGWSHFRLTTAEGQVIIINPFITGNPDASVKVEDIAKADVILAADGHGDEQGDSIAIAQNTGAKLIGAGFELGSWFIQQGVPAAQVIRTNPGDRHKFGGVTIRITGSVHGSGLPRPTIENPYGGPAGGFMITLENGFTVYFAGSSAATMDMQLWGSAFKPDLAILPLNGGRDPIDVGQMVRLLRIDNPNLTRVIPHHHRVQQPAGATTVAEMAEAIRSMVGPAVSVMEPQRGQVMTLSK